MEEKEFNYKKILIDELYKENLITANEWYSALSKLVNDYMLKIESNSVLLT